MADALHERLHVLEKEHDVLAENVRLTQRSTHERLVEHERELNDLRKAHVKLTIWLAVLASGGSAAGSALVNFLMKGLP